MQIAVYVNSENLVTAFTTVYDEENVADAGWQIVEADPNFNAINCLDWTVKDGRLVKASNGLTPLEEIKQSLVTSSVAQNEIQQSVAQLQQASISSTASQNTINAGNTVLKQANVDLTAAVNSQQEQIAQLQKQLEDVQAQLKALKGGE